MHYAGKPKLAKWMHVDRKIHWFLKDNKNYNNRKQSIYFIYPTLFITSQPSISHWDSLNDPVQQSQNTATNFSFFLGLQNIKLRKLLQNFGPGFDLYFTNQNQNPNTFYRHFYQKSSNLLSSYQLGNHISCRDS